MLVAECEAQGHVVVGDVGLVLPDVAGACFEGEFLVFVFDQVVSCDDSKIDAVVDIGDVINEVGGVGAEVGSVVE